MLSSNMHMYYLFGNHIYSLSLMVAPCVVSRHLILCTLTFSHTPDEAASVLSQQKFVYNKCDYILCFSNSGYNLIWIQTKLVTYTVINRDIHLCELEILHVIYLSSHPLYTGDINLF